MNDVKRFYINGRDWEQEEDPSGDLVLASDYDALAAQHEKGLKRWAELCLELEMLQQRLSHVQKGSERYEKLRRWMSSNVAEGWSEVEKLAAAACYVGWDAFDTQLDSLPVCNVGLCEVSDK